jgi:hypothetical protein
MENSTNIQADQYTTGEEAAAKKASRSFKKYQYRGVELDQLLDLSNEKFIDVSVLLSGKDCAYLYLLVTSTTPIKFNPIRFNLPPTTLPNSLHTIPLHLTARSRPSPKKVPART